jgi:mRNA interferase RelE/StbE
MLVPTKKAFRFLSMTYNLAFKKSSLKEWKKLAPHIRDIFKKQLLKRLENPRIPSAVISGGKDLYKIKLRQIGYRLVYSVSDEIVTVTVLAVGERDKNKVYDAALSRIATD